MQKECKKIFKFLLAMGKIGCIGFGGGSILIPVIEEEIINNRKIDNKENYDKDVVVASITPGALPVEIAASLGRRKFGYAGMIFGAIMMALPGVLLTVVLAAMLSAARSGVLTFVEFISLGVSVFIIMLLTKYIHNVYQTYKSDNKSQIIKAVFVMIVVFFLVGGKNIYKLLEIEKTPLLAVSTVDVLLVVFFFVFYTRSSYTYRHVIVSVILGGIYLLGSGKAQILNNSYLLGIDKLLMIILAIYGLVSSIRSNKQKVKVEKSLLLKDVGLWMLILFVFAGIGFVCYPEILQFVFKSAVSVLMSFGGGDAYLTVADGLFVSSDMITENQYYGQIVPIVNILPGSILCKTVSGVGYCIGLNAGDTVIAGILFAVIGFICSVAISCGFYSIAYYLYDSLIYLNIFQTISKWIRPIIAGLLINVMLSLCTHCIELSEDLSLGGGWILAGMGTGYIIDMALIIKLKMKTTTILAINLLVTFGIYVIGFLI